MHNGYNVELYVFGYHGTFEKDVGPKKPRFWVDAPDFKSAVKQAELILGGIQLNPNVWELGIESVIGVGSDEDKWPTLEKYNSQVRMNR